MLSHGTDENESRHRISARDHDPSHLPLMTEQQLNTACVGPHFEAAPTNRPLPKERGSVAGNQRPPSTASKPAAITTETGGGETRVIKTYSAIYIKTFNWATSLPSSHSRFRLIFWSTSSHGEGKESTWAFLSYLLSRVAQNCQALGACKARDRKRVGGSLRTLGGNHVTSLMPLPVPTQCF